MKPSRALAIWRLFLVVLWTLFQILVNLPATLRGRGLPSRLTMRWHSGVCRIAGISVRLHGEPALGAGVLMVSNHVSYIDIMALGANLPCSFVAKSDVAGWPIFGWLAKQQRTIFVERNPRRAAEQMAPLRERLTQSAECLVLFPEGTSSDGSRVLPFKSSLFQAAEIEVDGAQHVSVLVQPVSIAYTRLDGTPIGRAFRPFYAWYGDMELARHLYHWLGIGDVGIDITFHTPQRLSEHGSRKSLAAACEAAVAAGLDGSLRGTPTLV